MTNNTWSQTDYRAIQVDDGQEPVQGLPVPRGLHRQWQHLDRHWNPTDPARFIQPDAFANDGLIWRTDGMQDQNSLATGGTLTNNPMWNPYSLRFVGTWLAPWRVLVSGSYTIMAGP